MWYNSKQVAMLHQLVAWNICFVHTDVPVRGFVLFCSRRHENWVQHPMDACTKLTSTRKHACISTHVHVKSAPYELNRYERGNTSGWFRQRHVTWQCKNANTYVASQPSHLHSITSTGDILFVWRTPPPFLHISYKDFAT